MRQIKKMIPHGWKTSYEALVCSGICLCHEVETLELSYHEIQFLLAIFEGDRQTALQLLAAEHFYRPSLLPRLQKLQQVMKKQQRLQQAPQSDLA